jgi:hypothetical protein
MKAISWPPRFSRIGVRPNSPDQITSVSSSRPRCSRSISNAAIGWSSSRHLSRKPWLIASLSLAPCESHPQSKSCTNRTPRSTSRRASKQLFAKLSFPGCVA